jgi:hypothetical protein
VGPSIHALTAILLVSLISIEDFAQFSPLHRFSVTQKSWSGVGKNQAETGTTTDQLKMEGWLCPALYKYFPGSANIDFCSGGGEKVGQPARLPRRSIRKLEACATLLADPML